MKGIVFVELIRMAESVMGEDVVDDILDEVSLEGDAAFTSVGNYPCAELLNLVDAFGRHLNAPTDVLQVKFGHWMFGRFAEGYPVFFEGKNDAFDMLESIENDVHIEVRKLYPEAELPTFATERLAPDQLKMTYISERPLNNFCLGLIQACMEHFGQKSEVSMQEVTRNDRFAAEFVIDKVA